MIDLHAKRVTAGLRNRIPGAIWVALFAVAVLSLAAMGYHAGLVRTSRSLAVLAVALTFSAVIGLIADLDRPQEGALKVSQQALMDLRQSMQGPQTVSLNWRRSLAESTLHQVQRLVEQLSPYEQAHLLASLALRMAQVVTAISSPA